MLLRLTSTTGEPRFWPARLRPSQTHPIREATLSGFLTRVAIWVGITGLAATVTSGAFVMVSVFAIFASLHMVGMKELGLGLVVAVAVLMDALVVPVIVVPSLIMLLGRWNWGPGHVLASSRRLWRSSPQQNPTRSCTEPCPSESTFDGAVV